VPVADHGTNLGRTAYKAREHLRAVFSWAWEQELIDAPPRFPKPRPQRDVAGRPGRFEPRVKKHRRNHYGWLTKPRAEMKRAMAQRLTQN
jgi:hypothetical protein